MEATELSVDKLVSQRKLDSWRREWQKKLGLRDWKIKARIGDAEEVKELSGSEAVGCCQAFPEPKIAQIIVCEPDEDASERSKDIENTVVHELLHCHFKGFEKDEPLVLLQIEQIIEVIADALLREKRAKSGKVNRKD